MRAVLGAVVRSTVFIVLAACGSSSGNGHGDLLSLEIEPANATLTYTGTPVNQDYVAMGTYADGTIEPVPDAIFSLDDAGSRLGTFSGATFTAGGQGAGKGGVFAQAGELTAATSVIVVIHRTDLGPGVPADGATKFPDTSPPGAQSQTIVYPLDNAAMPSSVKAPVVQWEGA